MPACLPTPALAAVGPVLLAHAGFQALALTNKRPGFPPSVQAGWRDQLNGGFAPDILRCSSLLQPRKASVAAAAKKRKTVKRGKTPPKGAAYSKIARQRLATWAIAPQRAPRPAYHNFALYRFSLHSRGFYGVLNGWPTEMTPESSPIFKTIFRRKPLVIGCLHRVNNFYFWTFSG